MKSFQSRNFTGRHRAGLVVGDHLRDPVTSPSRKQGKRRQDRVALAAPELDVVSGFILRTALLNLKQTMRC